ncbi:8-amino-7-oxononanoate synthase [Methylocaldum szegediense]|uniref:8-amino-7-oxononanoate synthase n=1 Tax=Methylocaldum szegediense TaxID=73780 RepID=A0ABM9I1R6_9GAMM|nr:8-amino-7-oxononanoate synthase [Methylocaldum szegediense]CAI8833807.1 8-amino-7-oxononanoate synthase [Methylocaldum szegediense]
MWRDWLREQIDEIDRRGLYRRRRIVEGPQGGEVIVDGRRLVNFCSNDYLGLANHPSVVRAFRESAERYGVGAGAAHLVCGHGRAHHALEEELAEFIGRERALLFSTGYMANLGVISALVGRGEEVFEDRLNHASLLDAARLSDARLRRYPHADSAALKRELNASAGKRCLIATDGVFSMDGDLAPLPALAALAKQSGAWLMVDDAHGLGTIGDGGRGSLARFGLTQDDVPVLVGTLGKAFGTFGAFVAGSADLIEYLIQRSRTYIFTTALPPAVAEATRASLHLAREESWRREKVNALVSRFRTGAAQIGLRLMASDTPIQPVVVGDNETAVRASEVLLSAGFLVAAIRPPTVPVGTARLRVTFTAEHTEAQVDRLLEALTRLLPGISAGDRSEQAMTAGMSAFSAGVSG